MKFVRDIFTNLPGILMEPRFQVRIFSIKKKLPEVIILVLERPKKFQFIPGQYIWLVLPDRTKQNGVIDRRAFSIASATNDETIELLIRIIDHEYLLAIEELKVNDQVDIIGPMGSTFTAPNEGAIMIAGGTGVAPFLSILRSGSAGIFSLFAYESRLQPLHYEEELKSLSEKYGYQIMDNTGRPQSSDFILIADKADKRPIFIAGPQDFVDFVTTTLLGSGAMPERLRYEAFYPLSDKIRKIRELLAILNKSSGANKFEGEGKEDFARLGDLFFQLTRQTSNHVILTDHSGCILFANHAAEEMTGYTFSEMRGQTARLWGGLMSPAYYRKNIWGPLSQNDSVKETLINRRRDGRLYAVILTITPILDTGAVIGYVATEEDVTELMKINKEKSEFISLAAHQLRTPLTATKWYIEMLMSEKISKKQRERAQKISDSNQRMVDLVNKLLDVSRLELGVFAINPEPVDVLALMQSIVSEQKIQIEKQKINLVQDYATTIPLFDADPKLLRIVLENILSNAVKYTPEKGTVSISIQKNEKDILFSISDTGFGIPKDEQDKLFSKLFRASNIQTKNVNGTGLGMYIVKSIIDNSGGTIRFESQENKGTTFFITMPMSGMKKRGTKG